MNLDSVEDIRQSGFKGFETISILQTSECRGVPDERGVYLVLRRNTKRPDFLSESIGGHFKGKDPTVEVGVLKSKWVRNSVVLYIGKAGDRANRRPYGVERDSICISVKASRLVIGAEDTFGNWRIRQV